MEKKKERETSQKFSLVYLPYKWCSIYHGLQKIKTAQGGNTLTKHFHRLAHPPPYPPYTGNLVTSNAQGQMEEVTKVGHKLTPVTVTLKSADMRPPG